MRAYALAFIAVILAGCGGSKTAAPSGPLVSTNTITITSTGVSPKNVQIALGSRVMFVNNDARPHNMTSDPHPDHTDCPVIDQAGYLTPGQNRETGNLVVVRTCGFHDHDDPDNANLKGTITVK